MTSKCNHIHFSEQSRQKLLDNFCLWDGLIITANQPLSLTLIPYPPFGLVTISFLGLSAYLVFKGIYSASLSVALDSRLLNMIKRMTLDEVKFLNDIETSEMERTKEK